MENKIIFHLDKEYQTFFLTIKEQLKSRQIRAALSINKELIEFYWYLGCQILEKQKKANSEQFIRRILF